MRLVWLTFSKELGFWQLKLDPGDEPHPAGLVLGLTEFSGDIHNPLDWERINSIIHDWGFAPHSTGRWSVAESGWSIAVVERAR